MTDALALGIIGGVVSIVGAIASAISAKYARSGAATSLENKQALETVHEAVNGGVKVLKDKLAAAEREIIGLKVELKDAVRGKL